jgi:pilus assembly protein CpaB
MPTGGRFRGVLFLVASLIGALTVTFMIYGMIKKASEGVKVTQGVKSESSDVVVAAVDIPPGWTIKTDHLAKRQMPADYVPSEVYRTADEVVGRVAAERILAGEFIRDERLADPEAGVGLPAIIPRGMRALQVPVKDGAAVSGFLNPGNFVDLITVCAKAEPPEVRTLLQSVTVLAVDDRMTDLAYVDASGGRKRGSRVRSSVTMALTPQQAELVKYAFGQCRITLALRNDIDVTNVESNTPSAPPSASGPAGDPPADAAPAAP